MDQSVSPDTHVMLLLCSLFGQEQPPETKPLTPSEYNAVEAWLTRLGKRPSDLLQAEMRVDEAGLPPAERVLALLGRGVEMAAAHDRWQRVGIWVLGRGDDGYPERLRRNLGAAAPALLYGAGEISRLALGGLAIVGARDIDEDGLAFTRDVAERCASQGMQIVSGGARGVDQAAVAAALEAGGGAVVVLADRLDRAAAMRDAKQPLRDGRLTIVTPFDPESGFTVGKAMGRNKHIYALADFALVVRFTAGEGGTWGGAVEQLGRNQSGPARVPVFVRVGGHEPEAWRELQTRGALPFPEADFRRGNITELLAETAPASAPPTDLYQRFLSRLLPALQDEPGEKELAERLLVPLKQLRDWLKRALTDGVVAKTKKKGRVVYSAATREADRSLFDDTP